MLRLHICDPTLVIFALVFSKLEISQKLLSLLLSKTLARIWKCCIDTEDDLEDAWRLNKKPVMFACFLTALALSIVSVRPKKFLVSLLKNGDPLSLKSKTDTTIILQTSVPIRNPVSCCRLPAFAKKIFSPCPGESSTYLLKMSSMLITPFPA